MKRELTKEHIFNFEIKYRDKIRDISTTNTALKTVKSLNLNTLDKITKDIDTVFWELDTVYNFIDDYKDVIKWDLLSYFITDNLSKCLRKYNQYFTKKIWKSITYNSDFYTNEILVYKYRDKIDNSDLEHIANHYNLSPKMLLTLKDRIDLTKILTEDIFERTLYSNKKAKIKRQLTMYIEDHIEEILTYKREENKNA